MTTQLNVFDFQYLESDACMMEARFAAYNLQMPLVVCVVGQGKAWKMSEVGIILIIHNTSSFL